MERSVTALPLQSKTQRARVLRLLINAKGSWVPLPAILALGIAQYGARILELRRLGFQIDSRAETIDGTRHSWFRLVNSAEAPAPAKPETPKPEPEWSERPRVTGLELWDAAVQP